MTETENECQQKQELGSSDGGAEMNFMKRAPNCRAQHKLLSVSGDPWSRNRSRSWSTRMKDERRSQDQEKGQQPTVMSIQFLCFRARRQVLASFPHTHPLP
ncbi:uncharacterized protein LOC110190618 [Drosophila serrata]|uniref:uncharacterized protein LOC110190618 n=1 Tax=Drosophila serrata TaxID=7274 RepID=UPI000A1D148B|nr:uncharacterized protein LOC110190618 [Drosophila serrata]